MGENQRDNSDMTNEVMLKQSRLMGTTDGTKTPGSSPVENATVRPFEYALRKALEADQIAEARTMVANAEAVLLAHENATSLGSESMTMAHLAAAKARIAIATGDGVAAHAILVRAIERDPHTSALRTLMSEVMLAQGRAADVRPVLKHLGTKHIAGRDSLDEITAQKPTAVDTSG